MIKDVKPWMRRRRGETEAMYAHRVARSCYKCGQHFPDVPLSAIARHEDECIAGNGQRRQLQPSQIDSPPS